MTDYRDQIAAVVRAVTFPAPGTYTWFGICAPRLPAAIRGALTPATARNFLLYRVQAQLYRDFYRTGSAVPGPHTAPGPLLTGMTPFVEQLAAAIEPLRNQPVAEAKPAQPAVPRNKPAQPPKIPMVGPARSNSEVLRF